jgi:hypothetical protein
MLMQEATDARMDKRSVFKAIFYFLLARLGVRRLRGYSFFRALLATPSAMAENGRSRIPAGQRVGTQGSIGTLLSDNLRFGMPMQKRDPFLVHMRSVVSSPN